MAKVKEVTEAVDTSAEETIQEEVQHSDWFDRIKDYYDTKRWNLAMVKNAVKRIRLLRKNTRKSQVVSIRHDTLRRILQL